MPKNEEMVVITKTYDLILWSCNHTSRFPRQHRFVLGERLERNLYDLLETLIRAVVPCRAACSSAEQKTGPAGLVGRKTRSPCRVILSCASFSDISHQLVAHSEFLRCFRKRPLSRNSA